jgi:naphthoate synthase
MASNELTDVRYEVEAGLAWITIDRPERLNAFRNRTVAELTEAFQRAWDDRAVGVVALTGAGERAFCVGHDQKEEEPALRMRDVDALHRTVREIPKPVIAAVNGLAVGGGHVLHVLCDLTVAADGARFGQVGPRVGSFDAAEGTAVLARVVGEKRAREIWYLCELYDAETAERWGLVNRVVRAADLRPEVRAWADKLLAKSPTALRNLKHAFNANGASVTGFLPYDALEAYRVTEEAREGVLAFTEKRAPDFSRWR